MQVGRSIVAKKKARTVYQVTCQAENKIFGNIIQEVIRNVMFQIAKKIVKTNQDIIGIIGIIGNP